MIDVFKRAMRRITPLELAAKELSDAELAKLSAQTAQEWASAIVQYNTNRIARLRSFIAAQSKEAANV